MVDQYTEAVMTLERIIHPEMPDNVMSAFVTAVQAVKMQVPEKPIDKYYVFLKRNEHGCCPSCGTVCTDNQRHCTECGQALDWRD